MAVLKWLRMLHLIEQVDAPTAIENHILNDAIEHLH